MADKQLDAVFGALADPTRRAILARLKGGEASVAELAAPFAMSQPAVSRHLKVLEQAGLISRSRKATVRLSHLRAEPLRNATQWLAGYREFWAESFDRLHQLAAPLPDRPMGAPHWRGRGRRPARGAAGHFAGRPERSPPWARQR